MNTFLLLIMMIGIGAAIGGITNSLAIRMLFRPYQPKYIGNWRVPFTPGLIPKRRGELAEQMGKMVVNHLLTAEGIQRKLKEEAFLKEITTWAQQEGRLLIKSDATLAPLIEKYFHLEDIHHKISMKTETFLLEQMNSVITEIKHKKVKEVIPGKWLHKGEELIPTISAYITTKGVDFFESPEGKEKLSNMIDRFLMGKGTLGNMVSMFLGNDRLVDKVQPEVIKFLQDSGTKLLIERLVREEWEKIKEKEMEFFLQYIDKEDILPYVSNFILQKLPIYQWLYEPVQSWIAPYEEKIINSWVPSCIRLVGQALAERLGGLMKKLQLEEVVKSQVETFSVERLEEMVLSISRKEFKMITYLGALLGGIVGFAQGMIVLFLF